VDIKYSKSFNKYIRNMNGFSELREIEGGDHGLSGGSAFINHELILFFKRFDK
jgi:hypothetical protein